ncbi:MAG: hypothetical protein HFF88_10575, partial [Oscillibacter sp.]|nr:hypothetical protein [Oscillibacter sp.]
MVSFDLGGMASGLGNLAPGAAQLSYEGLQKKYAGFGNPRARVTLGGTPFDSV